MVKLVKTSNGAKLEGVGLDSLMGAMDRVMRGEKLAALPVASAPTDATEGGEEGKAGESWATAPVHKSRLREEREKAAMQDEVKRISSMYSEEQQKLDLMMKIQQARQRQALQRKLLQRRQGQGQGAHPQGAPMGMDKVRGLGAIGEGGEDMAGAPSPIHKVDLGISARGMALPPIMRK